MTTPPLPVLTPRRSRLRLWLTLSGVFVLLVVALLLLLGVRVKNRFTTDYATVAATLPAELMAAKKEGLPTTIEELCPKPPVTDADNAAPIYRKLTVLHGRQSKKEADINTEFVTEHLKTKLRTTREDAEIRVFLKKLIMELDLAEQGARKPSCDFARDWSRGFDTPFPELSIPRINARLLLLRAALKSDENQPLLALRDISLAGNIARHAASDPLIINALVKLAIQAAAHNQFVAILKRYGSNPAVLAAARDTAAVLDDPIDLRHTYLGELVLTCVTYSNLRHDPAFKEKMQKKGVPVFSPDRQVQVQMANAWQSRAIDYWRRVQKSAQESKGDLLTFEYKVNGIEDVENEHILEAGYEMNIKGNPMVRKIPSKFIQGEAFDNLRKTMMGILEYKQKRGIFPASMNALPDAPERNDPFLNEPLHYRKTKVGFILYSVGDNRKDDGGSEKFGAENWYEDIVVSYP